MNALLLSLSLTVCLDLCLPCALPYWWNEQFHFPPFYPSGQPKTTYKYVETFHQTNPNNFVHIQEYSEYTWWEHNPSKVNAPPRNFEHGGNVFFNRDFGFNTHIQNGHSATNNIVPRGNPEPPGTGHSATNNIVPRGNPEPSGTGHSATNNIVPIGEPADNGHSATNNIVPRGNPEPADSNNMIPSDKTDRVSPELETNGMVPAEVTPTEPSSEDLERNENERLSRLENVKEWEMESKWPNMKKGINLLNGWFGNKNPNETEPCQVSGSDIHSLRSMIEKMFSFPRELPENKEKARQDIINKFKEMGLQVWTQNFTTPPTKSENGTMEPKEGVNLVGVIPGSQRGHLDDEIVLVGAHYDTVADSKGVDDNGSGLAVMLEIARTIMEARCRLNNTLMFVAFDHEENGAIGSNYFVDHYLIPEELKRARARFQGAFILDGIMNYNDVPNTQELPLDYAESLPGLQYFVNHTGNRGNFLAMISRHEMDAHLSQKLMDAWQDLGADEYKLFNLAVDMGNEIPPLPVIERHLNFLRSDHATFWYHNSSSHFPESLNAVLLTDTGPFRGQMKECYHSECDDLTVMSPEKLQFAKKTADALTATLVELTRATAAGHRILPTTALWILFALVLPYTLKYLFL